MARSVEDVLFELSLRALDQQEREVASLHARTGTLLAVAALSTSFLGVRVLDGAHPAAVVVLAIATFVGTVVLAVNAIRPRGLVTGVDPREVAGDASATRGEAVRILALRLADIHAANVPRVAGERRAVTGLALLVTVLVVLWTLALVVT